jgi:hypothetical protein
LLNKFFDVSYGSKAGQRTYILGALAASSVLGGFRASIAPLVFASRHRRFSSVFSCATTLPVQHSRTTLLSAKTVSEDCITDRVLFDRLERILGNSMFCIPLALSCFADGAKTRLKDSIDAELARNLSTAK